MSSVASKPIPRQPVAPAYATYSQVIDLVEKLGIGDVSNTLRLGDLGVDKQAASRLNGSLRYLDLITESNQPTLHLQGLLRLVPSERRARVGELIKAKYAWAWELPPGAGLDVLRAEIQERGGLQGATLDLAVRFLTAADRDLQLGLPIVARKRGPRARQSTDQSSKLEANVPVPNLRALQLGYARLLLDVAEDQRVRVGQVAPEVLARLDRLLLPP